MSAWGWVEDRVEDARDAAGAAADWMYPGDSLYDRARGLVDGTSPLSPMYPTRELGETAVEAAPEVADEVGDAVVPGYAEAGEAFNGVSGFVGEMPGGWSSVGLLVLVLLAYLFVRVLVPSGVRVSKNVAKGAAATYTPTAYALSKGRPAPSRGGHAAGRTRVQAGRCGRPGKADVVTVTGRQLVVCAHDERAALVAAKRRWQGWSVRRTGSESCDLNPEKVHVSVAKRKAVSR